MLCSRGKQGAIVAVGQNSERRVGDAVVADGIPIVLDVEPGDVGFFLAGVCPAHGTEDVEFKCGQGALAGVGGNLVSQQVKRLGDRVSQSRRVQVDVI